MKIGQNLATMPRCQRIRNATFLGNLYVTYTVLVGTT